MALCKLNYRSKILGLSTEMNVILPEPSAAGVKPLCETPVLYLLHGLSDDANAWQRNTSIERYASELGICVVMPYGARSFFLDMEHGLRYFTHLSREIPMVAAKTFGLSLNRELNMIAGLSMGGYGAFRHALGCPDRYFAACSLSGPLDIVGHAKNVKNEGLQMYPDEFEQIFGESKNIHSSDNDLFTLLSKRSPASLPRLYSYCGRDDALYDENLRFRDAALLAGAELCFTESAGGHAWKYWDKYILEFLKWALK